jgi:hypothetical protein
VWYLLVALRVGPMPEPGGRVGLVSDRGPSFFEYVTDVIAIGVAVIALLVVSHSWGWWGG